MNLCQVIQLLIIYIANANDDFQITSCNDVNKETLYNFRLRFFAE